MADTSQAHPGWAQALAVAAIAEVGMLLLLRLPEDLVPDHDELWA